MYANFSWITGPILILLNAIATVSMRKYTSEKLQTANCTPDVRQSLSHAEICVLPPATAL